MTRPLALPIGRSWASAHDVRQTSPAQCVKIASECTDLAQRHLAHCPVESAHVSAALADAEAYLHAAHVLLAGQTPHPESITEDDLRRDGSPATHAAHYARTALLFIRQLSAPSGQDIADKARPAMALILAALAADRLQETLTQLASHTMVIAR
ncbi:hypothetical protein E0H26_25350 [Micromonospora zingiberis]|uniref:Uncharacterized protein n=1 Tax=Micromonospora zingiberis TaxID=2053011 RepID=A0A4R0G5H8_9ACTN|nr:hypothetical protein [Micromonospora zingiberis]TCB91616.1 hypothetical protein E0H26_25350 [Micromonospora zingiberis]